MGTVMKVLTGVFGVLAVIASLTTIGVVGYTMAGGNADSQAVDSLERVQAQPEDAVPTMTPENGEMNGEESDGETDAEVPEQPVSLDGHMHDYKESVDQKATCYQAGRLKYTCSICGDVYYVDVLSTGHVAGEWEVISAATEETEGLRVKKCIYCDAIVAQETIPVLRSEDDEEEKEPHVHEYAASTEREPTCILAGLRKYTCSCGDFYTEPIPAMGHVATDWTVVEEATSTKLGREQRTCSVCGVVLDSRPITTTNASASPSASAGTSATAAPAASASASAGASSSPGTHQHSYVSYVIKEANCSEEGIRSFVCSCGSSYAETIERDPNKHTYVSIVIPATETSPGYTLYRCSKCNYTYMDNYTQILK